jgi:cytoskeletal protein RodZ
MSTIRRTNLGGSIASFIIIGVILVAGLICVVYLLNQRSEQAQKEQEITTSKKQQTNKKSTNSSKLNNNSTKSEAEQEGAAATTPTAPSFSSDIPTTGPEVNITEISGLFLLSTSITGYILSRRRMTTSIGK